MKLLNYIAAGVIGISSSISAQNSLRTPYVTIPIENRLHNQNLQELVREVELASEIIPDKIQRALNLANTKIVLIEDYKSQPEYKKESIRKYISKKTIGDTLMYGLHLFNKDGSLIYNNFGQLDKRCLSACYIMVRALSIESIKEVVAHEEGHSIDIVLGNRMFGGLASNTEGFRELFEFEKKRIILMEQEEELHYPDEWFAQSTFYFYNTEKDSRNTEWLKENFDLLDYGAYQYRIEKAERKQKAHQKKIEVKGVRLSFKIGDHDLGHRVSIAKKFLEEGNKVKIEMILRGRENAHRDYAEGIFKKFLAQLESDVIIESPFSRQGNRVSLLIGRKATT